jgi:hypothetical protein
MRFSGPLGPISYSSLNKDGFAAAAFQQVGFDRLPNVGFVIIAGHFMIVEDIGVPARTAIRTVAPDLGCFLVRHARHHRNPLSGLLEANRGPAPAPILRPPRAIQITIPRQFSPARAAQNASPVRSAAGSRRCLARGAMHPAMPCDTCSAKASSQT